ncbi:MAG TPA: hypothetical protein VED37_07260 [Ktedonobacteraceae bacterium]|nr:hypothetical protein [Ktedonobacteraceae bacterium]
MNTSASHPCDELLKQWEARREEANFYFRSLLRLNPDSSEALQRRRELNDRVVQALLAWRAVDDQLQSCYQEYGERT